MGSFPQIFLMLGAVEALELLTAGYAAMALQAKQRGDNRGYERNLDRAQDAVAALRLITDLRCGNDDPVIINKMRPDYDTGKSNACNGILQRAEDTESNCRHCGHADGFHTFGCQAWAGHDFYWAVQRHLSEASSFPLLPRDAGGAPIGAVTLKLFNETGAESEGKYPTWAEAHEIAADWLAQDPNHRALLTSARTPVFPAM